MPRKCGERHYLASYGTSATDLYWREEIRRSSDNPIHPTPKTLLSPLHAHFAPAKCLAKCLDPFAGVYTVFQNAMTNKITNRPSLRFSGVTAA